MPQKAVIFDLDGVIFNTEDCWKRGFEIVTKKYDLPLDENYRVTICGKSEIKIIEELNEMFLLSKPRNIEKKLLINM